MGNSANGLRVTVAGCEGPVHLTWREGAGNRVPGVRHDTVQGGAPDGYPALVLSHVHDGYPSKARCFLAGAPHFDGAGLQHHLHRLPARLLASHTE